MAAPVIASTAQTTVSTAVRPWAVTMPAGVAAGDLLVAFLYVSTSQAFNPPTGWVERVDAQVNAAVSTARMCVYTRVANGTEGATVSFMATSNFTTTGMAYVLRVTGADATSLPFHWNVGTGSSEFSVALAGATYLPHFNNLQVTFAVARLTSAPAVAGDLSLSGGNPTPVAANHALGIQHLIGAWSEVVPVGMSQQYVASEATNRDARMGITTLMIPAAAPDDPVTFADASANLTGTGSLTAAGENFLRDPEVTSFPQVYSTRTTEQPATSLPTFELPSGIHVDDLLVVICGSRQPTSNLYDLGARGFKLWSLTTNVGIGGLFVHYKIADATDATLKPISRGENGTYDAWAFVACISQGQFDPALPLGSNTATDTNSGGATDYSLPTIVGDADDQRTFGVWQLGSVAGREFVSVPNMLAKGAAGAVRFMVDTTDDLDNGVASTRSTTVTPSASIGYQRGQVTVNVPQFRSPASHRSVATTAITAATSTWAVTLPSTIKVGDLLLAQLATKENLRRGSFTASGWAQDADGLETGGNTTSVTFLHKFATATDVANAGATVTFTSSQAVSGAAVVAALTDVTGANELYQTTPLASATTPPSYTPLDADKALIVTEANNTDFAGTVTLQPGWTKLQDGVVNGVHLLLAYKQLSGGRGVEQSGSVVSSLSPPPTSPGVWILGAVAPKGIAAKYKFGRALLTGTGTLAATGVSTVDGAATLTGSGSLTATGVVGMPSVDGAATLTGTSSLSATGQARADGTATLTGTSSLTASGVRALDGAATLSGAGALSATATAAADGAATLTGSGALTATGALTVDGAASLTGAGALSATATALADGAATLVGTGTLAATADGSAVGRALLVGAGSLTATGIAFIDAAASLAGTSSLTASGVAFADATALLHGVGTLEAGLGEATASGHATLDGVGWLTAHAVTFNPHGGFIRTVRHPLPGRVIRPPATFNPRGGLVRTVRHPVPGRVTRGRPGQVTSGSTGTVT